MSPSYDGREPCPDRIVDDFGGGFAMGTIGGSIFHGIRGWRNSPIGDGFNGAVSSIKTRAPVLGGSFAIWAGLFSTFDCSMQAIRQKEDSWNAITSGFLTGGVLAMRGGPRAAFKQAVIGGVILGVIEGMSLMLMKMSQDAHKIMPDYAAQQQQKMMQEQIAKAEAARQAPVEPIKGWWNSNDDGRTEEMS